MSSQVESRQTEGLELVRAGRAASKAGDYQNSERNFSAALAFGVEEGDCRQHLARIFNTQQEWEKSLEQWKWLRELDPERLEPHLQIARCCFRLGRLTEGAMEFQVVLRMAPDHAEAGERLGSLYLAQAREALDAGNPQAAEPLILSALERGTNETACRSLLARVYTNQSAWAKALEHWQWLHDKDRDNLEVRLQLGRVYVRLGRSNDARAHYEAVLKQNPQEQRAIVRLHQLLLRMARTAFETGNYRRSEQDFSRALELGADEATCRENLARIYSELRVWPKALEHQRWLAEARPDDLSGQIEYARLCFRSSQFKEAEEAFTLALAHGADPVDCHTSLARIHEERKNWVNAAAAWKAVVAHQPDRAEAHLRLARAFFALKRFDEARQTFEEVLRLVPEQAEARDGLARLQAIVKVGVRSDVAEQHPWLERLAPEMRWSVASQMMTVELAAVRQAVRSAQTKAAALAKVAAAYGVAEGAAKNHRELFRVQTEPALSEVDVLLNRLAHQLREFEQRTSRVVQAVAQETGQVKPPRAETSGEPMAAALSRALVRNALVVFRRHGLDRAVEWLVCAAEFEQAQHLLMEFASALQEKDRSASVRVYSLAYATAPTEPSGLLALQIAESLQAPAAASVASPVEWKAFRLTEPLPPPRYLPDKVTIVARGVSQIVLQTVTERIAKLGVSRSGAGEHYARLIKLGRGIVDYDIEAARFLIAQFGTGREIHDIGSGIGSLALLLGAMGVSVIGMESQVARYQSCLAVLQSFKQGWDRPAASVRFVHGRFPHCVSDADLSDKIAVLTGFVASVSAAERASIIAGLCRYAGVLIDTHRFLTPLKQEEDQERLLAEFEKAGFKHFYEASRSESHCLVLATTGDTLGFAAATTATTSKSSAVDDRTFDSMLAAAVAKGEAGDARAATTLLHGASEAAAGSFDRLIRAGEVALDVDDLDAAARCYRAARDLRPESDRPLSRMAQVAEARDDLDAACGIWKRASELRPEVPLYRFNMLRLTRRIGGAVFDAEFIALMTGKDWAIEGMYAATALRGPMPTWLATRRGLNGIFDVYRLTRFVTDAEDWQGLDSLRWDAVKPVVSPNDDALVTVVVPAYNAVSTIDAAVRSILHQAHANVEVIVVDDGSTDSTADALTATFGSDPRLKVERHTRNRGTYAAINAGLAAATGEYVCIQGADDVSHPRRLQLQLAAIDKPGRLASLCRYVRISEQGTLQAHSTGVSLICDSSLMFKRDIVLQRLGFMDNVRVGADTEFRLRLRAAFGKDSIAELREPLYLALSRSEGLTSSPRLGKRPYGGSGARRRYSKAFQAWHRQIEQGASPYVASAPRARPFAAPREILGELEGTFIVSE